MKNTENASTRPIGPRDARITVGSTVTLPEDIRVPTCGRNVRLIGIVRMVHEGGATVSPAIAEDGAMMWYSDGEMSFRR